VQFLAKKRGYILDLGARLAEGLTQAFGSDGAMSSQCESPAPPANFTRRRPREQQGMRLASKKFTAPNLGTAPAAAFHSLVCPAVPHQHGHVGAQFAHRSQRRKATSGWQT